VIPEIDITTLAEKLADGTDEGPDLIDVREAREYRTGHVPGARNLPMSVLPARLPELAKDRPVLAICQAGGRSAQATALLRAVGIDATSVAGGTGEWIASGRPVDTGRPVTSAALPA
jgi:rhodanese-related sulfurtransferase